MARQVSEWVASHDDQTIPLRVKLRVWMRANGKCEACTRQLFGVVPQFDHTIALINGGEHREFNLRLICDTCHKGKSKDDIAEKSVIYYKRLKNAGIKKKHSRPLPGTKASGLKKKFDGSVERRR